VSITVHNCRRLHNTAQNSSDNLPYYTPDNHHSSDNVYWRGGEITFRFLMEEKLWTTKSPLFETRNCTSRHLVNCQKQSTL